MLILGLDVETTGLDPKVDAITEIGAILWDTQFNTPVQFFNMLVDSGKSIPAEIVELTGITQELVTTHGVSQFKALEAIYPVLKQADYLMAHNAPFDKSFLEQLWVINGYVLPEKVWIDTSVDVDYPSVIQTRKLTHLAAEHKFVNPFAHRAVTDVLTMFQVCSHYPWSEIVESAKQPTIKIRAMVRYEERDKAKNTGFRWDGENKVWFKNIKEGKYETECSKAKNNGFEISKWS